MQVVSGLVESFMHKVSLEPGEKSCLESSVGSLAGDIMGTVGDVATGVSALVAGKGSIQKGRAGGVVGAGIDAAMKVTSLVASTTHLVKGCVHGDALILLNETAQHMINGTYLEHNFIVNGVDIAHSLSDSVVAFEMQDYHRFGMDIGVSLRKILLSTNNKQAHLPEGVPEEAIVQKATQGLMSGFFVAGSALQITDTARPDVNIVIDLSKCIAGNAEFFKEIWMSMWNLFAQLSVNGAQHGFNLAALSTGSEQPKWAGELMIAMMQFPTAMQQCGVEATKQKEFTEALQSLQNLKMHVRMPDDRFRDESNNQKTEETTGRVAKAVDDFTKWDFEGFGFEIGKMLRELVMLAIPENDNMLVHRSTGGSSGGGSFNSAPVPAASSAPAPAPAPAGDLFGNVHQQYSVHQQYPQAVSAKKNFLVTATSAVLGGAVIFVVLARFAMIAVRARGESSPSMHADSQSTSSVANSVNGWVSDVESGDTGLE
jgi:hypothetical protein